MHTSRFAVSALLLLLVLSTTACAQRPCNSKIPYLKLSDGNCEPTTIDYNFTGGELKTKYDPRAAPNVPGSCQTASGLVRTFEVEHRGGDRLQLHVYAGFIGVAQVQVFGAPSCKQKLTAVTDCLPVKEAVRVIDVDGLRGMKYLVVQVSFENKRGGKFMGRDGDFLRLAAYNEPPKTTTVKYRGIDRRFENQRLTMSCDGNSWQRVILSTCDPDDNLRDWVTETGMIASEEYEGDGGRLVVVNIPPTSSGKISNSTIRRKRVTANDDRSSTVDYRLTVPRPNESGLVDFNDAITKQPAVVNKCMRFEPGKASSGDRAEQMVVTMIDSGVEIGGEWDKIWEAHQLRYSIRGSRLAAGTLGYDYYMADKTPEDQIGHGTNTGGALIGNYRGDAPLTVLHAKIFGPRGASYFGALVALHEAVDNGSQVINCSWGNVEAEPDDPMVCALNYARANKVTVVTSAGNDNNDIHYGPLRSIGRVPPAVTSTGGPQWPASFSPKYPNLITVASYKYPDSDINSEPVLADEFSNYSKLTVNVAAYASAKTPKFRGTTFNYLAGTSISCPLIAAAVATSRGNGSDLGEYETRLKQSRGLTSFVVKGMYLPVCE